MAGGGSGIAEVINPAARSGIVLVCEHASRTMPDEYGDLGLAPTELGSHIAWDPGAIEIAKRLAQLLDATLIAHRVSRLVYDCNRPPNSPAAMPERSERIDIPGNRNLTEIDRQRRIDRYYLPFHALVEKQLSAARATGDAVLVTIHTFTPVYLGEQRKVEIGIVHDEDSRMADDMLAALEKQDRYLVGRNDPYGPADGVTHTLAKHALPLGLRNVMIEVRNDLVASAGQQHAMAKLLGDAIAAATGDRQRGVA